MTAEESRKFKEQQITAGIAALEQEEIKLEHGLGNTRAMLAHLRGQLDEAHKKDQ